MRKFNFQELMLSDSFLIEPFVVNDKRGSFIKDYSQEVFEDNGIFHELKEVFYTISKKGVIRAIHFQRVKEQAKLVRCISGEIFDVIVDLRPDSPTFKKWLGFNLSGENMRQLYIPPGFGHGYLVLKDAIVSYKCDEKFYPEYDTGIIWNDPTIGIKWPLEKISNSLILSEKDENLPSFIDYFLIYKI